ncbi:MAG: hypothetical protein NT067_03280 [Candidatus Diapherotrites archaeon]|nr:hypothetical protein [Candidatus Diapherotrites archaeon]
MVQRLEKLSNEELEALKAGFNGQEALIVMHPFYGATPNRRFERYLKRGGYGRRLTIIFEEYANLNALNARLERLGVPPEGNVLAVSTKIGSPIPTTGWQKIIGRLRFIGVKNLAIDGRLRGLDPTSKLAIVREYGKGRSKSIERRQKSSDFRAMARASAGRLTCPSLCVGLAWSKLTASGRFKARIRRRFR